ncbi:MAG: hypothetical protein OD918_04330 [Gammaproteobacteria bacterium]
MTRTKNGAIQIINGVERIFYDGYWIRHYRPPPESLSAKKELIDALTRRTFHHTEAGINTPGPSLEEARAAWQAERDPQRKRVNAAMLAGAQFNRATDIFTAIVELEERGVVITRDNELMRECAEAFTEALALSRQVRHSSGEEGVDELWGEPVKAFTMSIAGYYHSRYRKAAQAMREIDRVGETLHQTLCALQWFDGAGALVDGFIEVAKRECEIFRSDAEYYRIWPEFVADGEKLLAYRAAIPHDADSKLERHIKRGTLLLRAGKELIAWIANVRVPMPASTGRYLEKCAKYRAATGRMRA